MEQALEAHRPTQPELEILESIGDVCATFDPQWRYTYVNRRGEVVFRKSRAELLGGVIWELYPDLLASPFHEAALQAAHSGEAVHFEQCYAAPHIWVEGDVYPKQAGATVLLRDITERKRTEAELKKRNDDLQRITDNVPAGVSYLDKDLRFQRLSKGYEEVFGGTASDAIGKHLSEVVGEPHYGTARPFAERALRGERVAFESRILHHDGTLHDISVTYTPQKTGEGDWDGFIAMVQDVTDRKRYEADLEQARNRASSILESIGEAFFALDREWRFTYMNREAERILQRSREGLVGKNIWEEFPPAVESTFHRQYRIAMEQRCAVHFEEYYAPLDAWLEVRAFPWQGSAGADGLAIYFKNINERKRAEHERERLLDELDAERAKLRAIFESVPAGIVVAEAPSGRITFGNSQVEQILRHPVLPIETADPSRDLAAVPPDGRSVKAHEWVLARCLEGEPVHGVEVLYQRGDGTQAWIRLSGAPIRDRSSQVTGGVVACFDVDAERHAAEALRFRERELATLLDNVPDVISRYDRDLRFTLTSAAVMRHTGKPPEWFLGKTHVEAGFAAALAEQWDSCLRVVFETGRPERIEFQAGSPTGMRSYTAFAVPEFESDGSVRSVLTITHDETENRHATGALEESEQRLRIAIETARLGGWQLDLASGEMEASAQCKASFGRAPDESFAYADLLEAIHPQDLPSFNASLESAMREHSDFRVQHRAVWPDGTVHWIVASGRAIYADDGKPRRWVGVTLDITERKQAEEALMRQAEELARSNADLQQFAYVSSHDLQEPLRTITGFAQMLTLRYAGKLDAEALEFLAFIVSGARRMKALIDALLAYSRVVSTDAVPHTKVDLDAALHWAKMNLQAVIQESGAVVVNGELPSVDADHLQIVQLFQNLLSNAIKYRNPNQDLRIAVDARLQDDEWVIEVRDNGIGIDPQHVDRIFGVFKRLHGNNIPGTGIGLAICKRIVEKHGGRIWVESKPDEGSRFYFTLPA